MYKCKHFKIQELVSKIAYQRYGDFCWSFFREDMLQDLDTIREFHGKSITINNWMRGGANTQCGLRTNMDPLVKSKTSLYVSAHILGCGFDLHSSDIPKLYKDVETLYNQGKLKAIKRMESPKSTGYKWCHVDGFQTDSNTIVYFQA